MFSENKGCGETCAITGFVIVGLHNGSCSVEIAKDVLVELESSVPKGSPHLSGCNAENQGGLCFSWKTFSFITKMLLLISFWRLAIRMTP